MKINEFYAPPVTATPFDSAPTQAFLAKRNAQNQSAGLIVPEGTLVAPNVNLLSNSEPSFDDVWDAWKSNFIKERMVVDPSEVYELVGGPIGDEYSKGNWRNSCALKLSYAWIVAGGEITGAPFKGAGNQPYHVNLEAAISMFNAQLNGELDLNYYKGADLSPIQGLQGIVIIHAPSRSAYGHGTLYDGKQFIDGSNVYFNGSVKTTQGYWFWRLK